MNNIEPKNFEETTYRIYADASFDRRLGIAICTCSVMNPADGLESSPDIYQKKVSTHSCSRAEMLAVMLALDVFLNRYLEQVEYLRRKNIDSCLTIYTDNKPVAELLSRRAKIEAHRFRSLETGKELSNGDLYQDFFAILDRLEPSLKVELKWVKGHRPRLLRNKHEHHMSQVDQAARSTLRAWTTFTSDLST